MSEERRVKTHIVFVLKNLFEYAQKQGSLDLFLDQNQVNKIIYRLYYLRHDFKEKFVDAIAEIIDPSWQDNLDEQMAIFKLALERVSLSAQTKRSLYFVGGEKEDSFAHIYPQFSKEEGQKYFELSNARIYLNVSPQFIADLLIPLLSYIEQAIALPVLCNKCGFDKTARVLFCPKCKNVLEKGVPGEMKFQDYRMIESNDYVAMLRADKVVLYFNATSQNIKKILSWLKEDQYIFELLDGQKPPLFTKPLLRGKGIGYAPEPTAKQVERYAKERGKTRAAFSSLMRHIIATHVYLWYKREKRDPTLNEMKELADVIYKVEMKQKWKIEFELGLQ